MDWITLLTALAGTVVGGFITVVSQTLADRRRDDATVRAEGRTTKLAAIERNRGCVSELHERVSNDMAELTTRVSDSNDHVDENRAELLGQMVRDLSEKHGRAGPLIARVEDSAVREAVDDYYTTFARYLVAEEQRMMGMFVQNEVSVEEVWSSREKSTDAVRAHLRSLGDEEVQLFSSTTRRELPGPSVRGGGA